MNDPWKILGVSREATPEEIKKAYYDLVKKYHPDRYQDTPLKDAAQEKLKEINVAYDEITKHAGKYSSGGYYTGNNTSSGSYSSQSADSDEASRYNRIRWFINTGRINDAEDLLSVVPFALRSAEWYYLQGLCYLRRGWYAQAREMIERACSMDPSNAEYLSTLQKIRGGGTSYRNQTYTDRPIDNSLCSLCQCLLCSTWCCPCFCSMP